ncbi:MAG: inosine/xanthosine triphosphatase [Candidatus Diapherotrites archaeon]|nr:inosine/xanthosine triphosphatase [Candidatus Diapherotrites archaeon]
MKRKIFVAVGSKNPAKVSAVESAFKKFFKEVKVRGAAVGSGVAAQPMTLRETVQGAVNRAKSAWEQASGKCDYSVGIEAGLFEVPCSKSGYMDAAAIAIFDGRQVHLGLTPAFEYPLRVTQKILREGKEVSDVFAELWGEDLRDEKGGVGRLTKGRVPRRLLHEMGLIMALAPIVNKKYYR